MEEYKPPLEGRKGFLRLDFNENTIGCSPKALAAINSIKEEDISSYPEYGKFKAKLAGSIKVKPEQLMVTNAADEAIMVVMQAYIEKQDQVILPVPTFAMFRFYASLMEAEIKEVLYKKSLEFPCKKVLDSITKKTRMVILCSPNNPTGTIISKDDVIKVIEKADKNDAIVLLDEAYYQYSGQECLGLIEKYSNLIIIRTFSKAYGMAGLRLGYAVSNREMIKDLMKVCSPYSANAVSMAAASAAIYDIDYVRWYVEEVKKAKKIVYGGLKKLGIAAYPSHANFILAKFPNRADEVVKKLKEKKILVRDRSSYPLLKDCIRISIGTVKQAKVFLDALKEVLR
ncbi:histidinol-phosphate transaminase [Candidatus Woesearchaeota archaeon]|nr:histidinol-phosphate transaminase [Candidatus Woesearchaeota archaeon]